jgi:hypothetical protein
MGSPYLGLGITVTLLDPAERLGHSFYANAALKVEALSSRRKEAVVQTARGMDARLGATTDKLDTTDRE